MTLGDEMLACAQADAYWLVHIKRNNLHASDCGSGSASWRAVMEKVIFEKFPGRFKSFSWYERAKATSQRKG